MRSSPTCVPPHRQVLVLLDVQHDLQPVARPSLHGGVERLPLLRCVEHVALAVPGENLEERERERERERGDLSVSLIQAPVPDNSAAQARAKCG